MTVRRPILRAQDMVFTLFGDALLRREEPVRAGALVTLLGRLGMRPMAVRTTLSRMTRRGWLSVERDGPRSYYGLTRRARRLLEEGRERIYHPPAGRTWDGQWSIVTYAIPEDQRPRRDALRARLAWLGCGALSSGVWISPHDVGADVRRIADELKATPYVEVFRGRHAGYADTAELVRHCWDLADLDRRYGAFIRRWSSAAAPRGATAAEGFRRRFLLVHEYRVFPPSDPYLPASLLPAGWRGTEAARLFERAHDVLEALAVRYVNDVCDQEDDLADAA